MDKSQPTVDYEAVIDFVIEKTSLPRGRKWTAHEIKVYINEHLYRFTKG